VQTAALIVVAFVALYPVVTAGFWVAGGLLFRWLDENTALEEPAGGWPGVSVLIPAFNEEAPIATCVRAALAVDYPELELLVLDDGSTDRTADVARDAGGGDPRLVVIRDPVNRGKAEQLNEGLRRARNGLVAIADADTHLTAPALKLLVGRILRSSRVGAVAGAPHVTNRNRFICALQVLEAESIIGLIRRTQALSGSVGTVAGVLGLFRREAVLEVGGWDGRMATEDIDLSWRLLLAGWDTAYEPRALVGMQVPATVAALWQQRKRWARGQGEVLHTHAGEVMRWRNRWLWPLVLESAGSLVWVSALALSLVLCALELVIDHDLRFVGFSLAWGIAVAVISTLQLAFALAIDWSDDRRAPLAFLIGPLYPIGFWLFSAAAALRSELMGLKRGPSDDGVTWSIARDRVEA
jgi:biofilm PGA synthesis N-glycosyltransferase PgaC